MNARSLPRRSHATVADKPDIFPANALRAATATTPVVLRNATSADKLATLRATAPKVVTTVAATVAATVEVSVVPVVPVVPVVVSRPATLAVASATWPVIAPRARSATTVSIPFFFFSKLSRILQLTHNQAVRLAMSLATALPRPRVSACAISASSPATFSLLALTKVSH